MTRSEHITLQLDELRQALARLNRIRELNQHALVVSSHVIEEAEKSGHGLLPEILSLRNDVAAVPPALEDLATAEIEINNHIAELEVQLVLAQDAELAPPNLILLSPNNSLN